MGQMNFARFARFMKRSADLAAPGGNSAVVNTYKGVLQVAAEAFLAAHAKVTSAETIFGKKETEASAALAAIDQPYRLARITAVAFLPELVLPETLSQQPTDTDQTSAVGALFDAVKGQGGQTWADDLMAETFGQLAPGCMVAIGAATAANIALADARTQRLSAYEVAYPLFVRFKKVVREAFGEHSKQYRRIHAPKRGAANDEETDATATQDGTAAAPAAKPGVSGPDGTGTSPASKRSTTLPATPDPSGAAPATPAGAAQPA
jgi:hypothetical protein